MSAMDSHLRHSPQLFQGNPSLILIAPMTRSKNSPPPSSLCAHKAPEPFLIKPVTPRHRPTAGNRAFVSSANKKEAGPLPINLSGRQFPEYVLRVGRRAL